MHRLFRVTAVRVAMPYALELTFDDGTFQRIDLEPVLRGELFGPLRDPEVFAAAALDPEAGTVVWPNGADFDPETLHDWPERGEAFIEAAREWSSALST